VPARHAGEAMSNVFDLDVERRRIEEIEPAARQHPLPRPRRCVVGAGVGFGLCHLAAGAPAGRTRGTISRFESYAGHSGAPPKVASPESIALGRWLWIPGSPLRGAPE